MRSSSVAAIVMVLVGASTAEAEPAPRKPVDKAALDHNARAAKLFGTQDFEGAASEYRASALIESAPVTDLNLGQCYRILGERADGPLVRKQNYEKALWHYERFIKASPETPALADQIRALITPMREYLAANPQPTPPQTPAQPITTAPPTVIPATPSEPGHWYQDGVGWALAGTGALTLGVAAGFFVSASNLNDDATDTPDQKEQNALRDKADTRTLLGTTLSIVGGGLLISGVIKLVVHDAETRPQPTVGLGLSSHGVVVFGRF